MLQFLVRLFLFLSVGTVAEGFASLSFGIPISANKLFTIALLGFAALQLLGQRSGLPANAKNVWAAVFGFAVLPSLATAFIMGVGISQVVNSSVTVISLILFYYVLAFVVREPRDVQIVVWALVIGGTIGAATTIAGLGAADTYYERGGGLGGNPNLSALYAVTTIGIASYMLVTTENLAFKAVAILAIGTNLLAVVQTVSRAGFLSLLVLGGFLLLRFRRLDLLQFAIPAVVLGVLAFVVFAPETYFDRISTIGEQASDLARFSTDNERIRGWYYGMLAFLNYPLSGCGIKAFKEWLYVAYPDAPMTPVPHSSYIRLLATTGLAGTIPWVVIVLLTWIDFSRVRSLALARRADEQLRDLFGQATFFQGVFLTWLFAGLVSPFEWEKALWLSFGMSTALLAMARRRIRELDGAPASDREKDEPEPMASSWVPPGLQTN
ncbi:MAG: O-antigen ligase family protein [Myxococcota bacterium]|nr:O-antigen ligase family protein [Myxococcota bacterium]